jgi:hypothetical protein
MSVYVRRHSQTGQDRTPPYRVSVFVRVSGLSRLSAMRTRRQMTSSCGLNLDRKGAIDEVHGTEAEQYSHRKASQGSRGASPVKGRNANVRTHYGKLSITAFEGPMADALLTAREGDAVSITGELKLRTYEKDGVWRAAASLASGPGGIPNRIQLLDL